MFELFLWNVKDIFDKLNVLVVYVFFFCFSLFIDKNIFYKFFIEVFVDLREVWVYIDLGS